MTPLYGILLFIVVQRLAELFIARRNTARLMAKGATEYGAGHYPLIVALHGAWILSLLVFVPAEQTLNMGFFTIFIILQGLRVWIIRSLGPYWTTRVIVMPGHKRVSCGPYRWLRHPNYLVVFLEILVLPLTFDAWEIALIFTLLNGVLLAHRVRIEDSALSASVTDNLT